MKHFYYVPTRRIAASTLSAVLILVSTPGSIMAEPDMQAAVQRKTDSASKPKVRVSKGNLLVSGSGKETRLTDLGLDSEPQVSPDGSRVAFVRSVPGKEVETAVGEVPASEIWIADTDGSAAPRQLVTYTPDADKPEDTLADFGTLRFSLDGKTLYFGSSAWTTSGALKAVKLDTGKVRHLAPSNGFELLTKGKYKGHFVSNLRKSGPDGADDKPWLLSPDGKELRQVGEDLAAAVKQLEKE